MEFTTYYIHSNVLESRFVLSKPRVLRVLMPKSHHVVLMLSNDLSQNLGADNVKNNFKARTCKDQTSPHQSRHLLDIGVQGVPPGFEPRLVSDGHTCGSRVGNSGVTNRVGHRFSHWRGRGEA